MQAVNWPARVILKMVGTIFMSVKRGTTAPLYRIKKSLTSYTVTFFGLADSRFIFFSEGLSTQAFL